MLRCWCFRRWQSSPSPLSPCESGVLRLWPEVDQGEISRWRRLHSRWWRSRPKCWREGWRWWSVKDLTLWRKEDVGAVTNEVGRLVIRHWLNPSNLEQGCKPQWMRVIGQDVPWQKKYYTSGIKNKDWLKCTHMCAHFSLNAHTVRANFGLNAHCQTVTV